MRLAIPSMLMLCLEWWLFEVGAFLAGQISEAELGAQSVTYELTVVAYMVSLQLKNRVGDLDRAASVFPRRSRWVCQPPPASGWGTPSEQEDQSRPSCPARCPWLVQVRTGATPSDLLGMLTLTWSHSRQRHFPGRDFCDPEGPHRTHLHLGAVSQSPPPSLHPRTDMLTEQLTDATVSEAN